MYFTQAGSLSPVGLWQGSILGSTLFNIFIKYLDDGIESTFTNFAADAKLGNEVDPSEGKSISERNPDRLEEWAGKNRVKTTAKSMRKD